MSAEATHTGRIQLPRSLLGRRRSFEFRIGQQVDFHGDRAVITGRQLTAIGKELYDITMYCADRPHRTVRGEYLVATDEYRDTTHLHANSVSPARRHVLLLPSLHDDQLRAA
ncbi:MULTISPECIES: hypothetical protein [Rhizobium]|uniref:hypothetical protein n=1 Tax=Rhizobium TaxID=379 RepID=UPI0018856B29|nr:MULTISPECIES: hypothetical protein [Rhizobium]